MPEPPIPLGSYERGIIVGGVGYVSGQFPIADGRLAFAGLLGASLSVADGEDAARIAALNAVAQIDHLLDHDWDRLDGLLRIDCYVACARGFSDVVVVLDAASECFLSLLAGKGRHARSALIVSKLPLNAPIELVVTFAVNNSADRRQTLIENPGFMGVTTDRF
jgi:enamine deaminase RidA (YjgF/YER057c/UK114 family)